MLSDITLIVIMEIVVLLSVVMLNVVMLRVSFCRVSRRPFNSPSMQIYLIISVK